MPPNTWGHLHRYHRIPLTPLHIPLDPCPPNILPGASSPQQHLSALQHIDLGTSDIPGTWRRENCWSPPPRDPLPTPQLRECLDPETYELFTKKLTEQELMRDPKFQWCTHVSVQGGA